SLSSENRLSSPASTGVPSLEDAGDTPCLEVNKHNNLQQIVVFCSKTAGTPYGAAWHSARTGGDSHPRRQGRGFQRSAGPGPASQDQRLVCADCAVLPLSIHLCVVVIG